MVCMYVQCRVYYKRQLLCLCRVTGQVNHQHDIILIYSTRRPALTDNVYNNHPATCTTVQHFT